MCAAVDQGARQQKQETIEKSRQNGDGEVANRTTDVTDLLLAIFESHMRCKADRPGNVAREAEISAPKLVLNFATPRGCCANRACESIFLCVLSLFPKDYLADHPESSRRRTGSFLSPEQAGLSLEPSGKQ